MNKKPEMDKATAYAMSMRNHQPGTKHTGLDGVTYVVMPSGAWLRVTKKLHEPKTVFESRMEAARTRFPRTKAVI